MSDERELVVRLMDGYLGTQLLHVAAQLRLADLLSVRPRRAAELAAAAGADVLALSRILRGLVLQGIVSEDHEGMFHLTDAGHYLRSDTEDSLRGAIISRGDFYYGAAAGLLESARKGGSAFHHACGGDLFETIAASPERLAAFQQSMVARARVEAKELVRCYDFSSVRHIVDVGGGFGITLAAILQSYRDLRGTLFDRPEVIATAHEWLIAAGVTDRCSVVPGDAFSSLPDGGDVYLLSRVIHDWDDDAAVRLFLSCRNAMSAGARLLLVEAVVPPHPADEPAVVWMDLHMMTLTGGRERTLAEFSDLLGRAGFRIDRVVRVSAPLGFSIIEATTV